MNYLDVNITEKIENLIESILDDRINELVDNGEIKDTILSFADEIISNYDFSDWLNDWIEEYIRYNLEDKISDIIEDKVKSYLDCLGVEDFCKINLR